MSTKQEQCEGYIAMRRALGYKFVPQAQRLAGFVAFMEQRGETHITTKVALEWATQPVGLHASWALRLADVRGFAKHLLGSDSRTEIPPTGIVRYHARAHQR